MASVLAKDPNLENPKTYSFLLQGVMYKPSKSEIVGSNSHESIKSRTSESK